MSQEGRMYEGTKTWNPFRGCKWDCTYCEKTFKAQSKRRWSEEKQEGCIDCYNFALHYHPEKLKDFPSWTKEEKDKMKDAGISNPIIFVCGYADICFCKAEFVREIITAIQKHNLKHPEYHYYFQTKSPVFLKPFLEELPENAYVVTTLETNRNEGYREVSKAPLPMARYKQLLALDFPRKIVTIEPVMQFDHDEFLDLIININPEKVWIGYDSHPLHVIHDEPSKEKLLKFIDAIREAGIKVKEKDMRDKADIKKAAELEEKERIEAAKALHEAMKQLPFTIDQEFKDLIPPLSEEEFSQLEASILEEGVRDPLVVWKNGNKKPILAEGHHRSLIIAKHGIKDDDYAIIEREWEDRDAVKTWIINNQCGRRNLPLFTKIFLQIQKHEISLRQKAKENQKKSSGRGKKVSDNCPQPFWVSEQLAKLCGVSEKTIKRVLFLKENEEPEALDALKCGEISINEAFTTVKKSRDRAKRQEAHDKGLSAFKDIKVEGDMNVHHGDFRMVSKKIEDDSVDLILTDPPYDADSIALYGDLAEMAHRVLKPGGSLICYCGNKYLPDVLAKMTQHLKFYWSMACIHSGGSQHEQHHRNTGIIGRQKPVLWFVKEKRGDRMDFIRDAIEGKMDKRYHKWGQSVIEAKYFIEHLTQPNETVYDPMLGGGTVCVAAKELKRQWIGSDIDKSCVETSRKRLVAVDKNNERKKVMAEKHHIICGDAREVYPKLIKDKTRIDLILCDPPYNIGYGGYDEHHDSYSEQDYISLLKTFKGDVPLAIIQYPEETMKYVVPALGAPDKVLAWCYNSNLPRQYRLISIYNAKPDMSRIKQAYKNPSDKRVAELIHAGSDGTALYDWFSDIQLVKNVTKGDGAHPCPVPVELMERLILLLTNEGDTIYDPFLGSGTTMVSAKQLGRRGLGSELSFEYCEMARERLKKGE